MKEAIQTGFNELIDQWWNVVKRITLLIFTLLMITFTESIVIYETTQFILEQLFGSVVFTISDTNILSGSFTEEKSQNYFYFLFHSTINSLILINSFFLGIYLLQRGYPEKENKIKNDHLLDAPIKGDKYTFLFFSFFQSSAPYWQI